MKTESTDLLTQTARDLLANVDPYTLAGLTLILAIAGATLFASTFKDWI